jgi:hypothetical protein
MSILYPDKSKISYVLYYRGSLFNVKAMKSAQLPPVLTILYLIICIYPQGIHAESIAKIEHPKITIKDDRGDELIQIQAVAELSNISINGFRISELSDLAWDEDENLLYALSDNGYMLSFRAIFKDEQFHDLLLISGFALHDDKGKKLRWKKSDSEGLTLINSDNHIPGDTQYIVSFERHPRVIQYNREGFIEKEIELPEKLGNRLNYRSENKSLESVVMHKQHGLMIGTEYSLKGEDKTQLGFYTLDGKFRSFPAHFPDGALTGLAITKNNSLLAIERIYGGFLAGFKVALHHLHIANDHLEDKVIARFLPSEGYFNDNFEGIVKYKKDFYFMISDDNNHPLQRTVLIYFKYAQ